MMNNEEEQAEAGYEEVVEDEDVAMLAIDGELEGENQAAAFDALLTQYERLGGIIEPDGYENDDTPKKKSNKISETDEEVRRALHWFEFIYSGEDYTAESLQITDSKPQLRHSYTHIIDQLRLVCDWGSNLRDGQSWKVKNHIMSNGFKSMTYPSVSTTDAPPVTDKREECEAEESSEMILWNTIDTAQQIYRDTNQNGTVPYSVFHLLQKLAIKDEFERLSNVLSSCECGNDDMIELDNLPSLVILTIATYSAAVRARITDSGHVHFSYFGIFPNEYLYSHAWFIAKKRRESSNFKMEQNVWGNKWLQQSSTKKEQDHFFNTISTDFFTKDGMEGMIGEVVHIWEPCHLDPRYVTERKEGTADLLVYFGEYDVCTPVTTNGVRLVGLEIPPALQQTVNTIIKTRGLNKDSERMDFFETSDDNNSDFVEDEESSNGGDVFGLFQ